jgi:site-specific DNA-methyltransferase (adenine-specific)
MSDFIKINEHAHIFGDSTNLKTYEELMGNDKAKMLYSDPPYCLLVRRNKKTGQLRDPKKAKINHEAVTRYKDVREYRKFTRDWMSKACKYITDDGVLVIWTNYLGKKPIKDTAEELGYKYFYGEFLWGKLTKEVNSGNETNVRVYEVALVFSKVPKKKFELSELTTPWSIITRYDEDKEADTWDNHPNHKPFTALEPLIRAYTKPGEIVLDTFTGSGSTPSATIKLGRIIRGIEILPEWASITQMRMQALIKE